MKADHRKFSPMICVHSRSFADFLIDEYSRTLAVIGGICTTIPAQSSRSRVQHSG
jgi:hypothetical protein